MTQMFELCGDYDSDGDQVVYMTININNRYSNYKFWFLYKVCNSGIRFCNCIRDDIVEIDSMKDMLIIDGVDIYDDI
jgi:hypothetical protein